MLGLDLSKHNLLIGDLNWTPRSLLDIGYGDPLGLVEICWDGWLMGWIGDLNWDISRGCLHLLRMMEMKMMGATNLVMIMMMVPCLMRMMIMLGSKDLDFYVFRTLICIVGKP